MLQALRHGGAEAAQQERILARRLQVPAPARVADDVDVGAPAVEADRRQVRLVIFSDLLPPQAPQLHADDAAHAMPDALVEGGPEEVWVREGRGAPSVALRAAAASRLHPMDAIPTPVVLRDAQAADVAQRTVARLHQQRLLLEAKSRDHVLNSLLDGQLRIAEGVRVLALPTSIPREGLIGGSARRQQQRRGPQRGTSGR
mmetsp:Transcript_58258/g.167137  ORF Transcript_58258/g.167137 Transcript_58258/m.167137 type:complete len:201 (-) Transcript_58258:54-656(-)